MQQNVNRAAYDQMFEAYLAERERLKSGKYVQKLLKKLPRDVTILDVGCGAGIPIDNLLLDSGHRVVGIDVSPKMIALAQKLCPEGTYFIKDILELKKGEYQVEAIVSFYAMFHLPRARHEEILRVLASYLPKEGLMLLTMGERDFEGYHDLHGAKVWSSQWSAKKNREIISKIGLKILNEELDQSGGETHQVLLLEK